MILKDFFIKNALERPTGDAFLFMREGHLASVSWADMLSHIQALGTSLLKKGTRRPIFILGENSYPWMLAHSAAVCGAGTAIGLDKELGADQLIGQVRQLEDGVVFYSRAYLELAQKMGKMLPRHDFICLDGEDFENLLAEGGRLLAAGEHAFTDARPLEEDLAAVLFTSGTTAGQKGVMLSQRNILTAASGAGNALHFKPSDRVSLLLPLHHAYACYCSGYSATTAGAVLCVFPGFKRIFDLARQYRSNKILMVPELINGLLAELETHGVKSQNAAKKFFGFPVDCVVSGGAPLPLSVAERLKAYGITVIEGYGMTECSPLVAANPLHAPKAGTVGRVIAGCEVRIAPDGEIMVRGTNVMLGYLNALEAQEKAFQDGWFLTGDIGSLDEDGYLSILGRKKNMILLANGKNVFPEELEEKLLSLQSVLEARVFQEQNEIVAEVYATAPWRTVEKEILELSRNMPPHKRIHRLVPRDAPLERSSLQKIIRR